MQYPISQTLASESIDPQLSLLVTSQPAFNMTFMIPGYPSYPLSSAEQTSSIATVDGDTDSTFDPTATYHHAGHHHYYDGSGGYHHQHPYHDISQAPHTLITGILLCLMLILFILLCYLAIPLLMDCVRSRMPVSTMKVRPTTTDSNTTPICTLFLTNLLQKERRFLTIEGWLITKVRPSSIGA